MRRFLFTFLLFFVVVTPVNSKGEIASVNKEDYLYHTDEASGVIIDYEPASITPDFIYGADQGPRVIEFYAPWCPHVR
jgi:hypothetical protein